MIGVCTAVIGDVAGHLGCFIYLKDQVNAIAFVALGTSVPGKRFHQIFHIQQPLILAHDQRRCVILFVQPFTIPNLERKPSNKTTARQNDLYS